MGKSKALKRAPDWVRAAADRAAARVGGCDLPELSEKRRQEMNFDAKVRDAAQALLFALQDIAAGQTKRKALAATVARDKARRALEAAGFNWPYRT